MARATLAVQTPLSSGLNATYTTVTQADGAQFTNNGRSILHVKNPTGGSITLTIVTPGTYDGLALADRTVAIGASGERFLKFDKRYYNGASDLVTLNISADGLTMAVVE